jgi:hypothetical protein
MAAETLDPAVRRFLDDPSALARPLIESPFFEHWLALKGASPERETQARRFAEEGYLILDDFVPSELIDAIVARYDWLFDPRTEHAEAPVELRELLARDPNRKQDAWFVCPPIRELACEPRILELLAFLYGREAIPFQTLNFLPGTQQRLHADSIHFSSIPTRFMCGVWVALEDATEDNGALQYVPGSHRFDELQLADLGLHAPALGDEHGSSYKAYEDCIEALVEGNGMEVRQLVIPRGSALVWASNLIHGGGPIRRPGVTRMSQVTHYYFENCVYYSPLLSNPALGEYHLNDIYDIHRDRRPGQLLLNDCLEVSDAPGGRRRLWRQGSRPRPVSKRSWSWPWTRGG